MSMDQIKKDDRVIHNDATLYGAPVEDCLGTALEDQTGGRYDGRVLVRWDDGQERNESLMDCRKYFGGSAERHQTDEEASDIAKLDAV